MSESLRRGCVATLILLALVLLAPPDLGADGDGLPAFDDNDDDAPAVCFHGLVAAVPAACPTADAPTCMGAQPDDDVRLPESAPLRSLPSRSPPAG